ncbi:LOW QUALITY PROTEIN: hypothetical protein J0S82_013701, partial [Galemys pyrenaicus]
YYSHFFIPLMISLRLYMIPMPIQVIDIHTGDTKQDMVHECHISTKKSLIVDKPEINSWISVINSSVSFSSMGSNSQRSPRMDRDWLTSFESPTLISGRQVQYQPVEVYMSGGDPKSVSVWHTSVRYLLVKSSSLSELLTGGLLQAINMVENNRQNRIVYSPMCLSVRSPHTIICVGIWVLANILYIQRTKNLLCRTTYKYFVVNKQIEELHVYILKKAYIADYGRKEDQNAEPAEGYLHTYKEIFSYDIVYPTTTIGTLLALADGVFLMKYSIRPSSQLYETASSSLLPFLWKVDQGMIHITNTKVTRYYGVFFIQKIHKFEGSIN